MAVEGVTISELADAEVPSEDNQFTGPVADLAAGIDATTKRSKALQFSVKGETRPDNGEIDRVKVDEGTALYLRQLRSAARDANVTVKVTASPTDDGVHVVFWVIPRRGRKTGDVAPATNGDAPADPAPKPSPKPSAKAAK